MYIACENRTVRKIYQCFNGDRFLVVRFGVIAISFFTMLSTNNNKYILITIWKTFLLLYDFMWWNIVQIKDSLRIFFKVYLDSIWRMSWSWRQWMNWRMRAREEYQLYLSCFTLTESRGLGGTVLVGTAGEGKIPSWHWPQEYTW